ncbi:hypothetical protein [Thermococcus sp. LS2]|uniref:hypothetical protein n=1 Tax=Thermococcus sp. LS2 TaxID=1638260 RepID=UPI001439A82C|nr:hypothetical protein [Thermococcus sp. LS2]NJE13743.1 hypothetical protein [Thermococcus sp. LS2]
MSKRRKKKLEMLSRVGEAREKLIVAIDKSDGYAAIVVIPASSLDTIYNKFRWVEHFKDVEGKEKYIKKFLKKWANNKQFLLFYWVYMKVGYKFWKDLDVLGDNAIEIIVDDNLYKSVKKRYPRVNVVCEGRLSKEDKLDKKRRKLINIADNLANLARRGETVE